MDHRTSPDSGPWESWESFVKSIGAASRYLGPWQAETRYEHHAAMIRELARDLGEPCDYLEFGVGTGQTIKIAANVLSHPDSRLYGFDSFTGLPQNWEGRMLDFSWAGRQVLKEKRISLPMGTFSTSGLTPFETGVVDDQRISIVKGFVEETICPFILEYTPSPKILYIDINLYSATHAILHHTDEILAPGDFLVFDELYDIDGEFRALNEYLAIRPYRHLVCEVFDGKVFAFRVCS